MSTRQENFRLPSCYPGVDNQVWYKEDIFVGSRFADRQKKLKPLFAFGHGLSYTTFEYGKPQISSKTMTADASLTLRVDVTNTGSRKGKEVVQLYISDRKSSLPRPVKELKDFRKIELNPGETKTVEFQITPSMLSFFDSDKHEWVAEPGDFEAVVASSSADLRGKQTFTLK